MSKWLAARVATGKEYEVKKQLVMNFSDCEVYIPRRLVTSVAKNKVVQKTVSVLPGYIIVKCSKPITNDSIEGYIKVLGPISEDELDNLRTLEYHEDKVLDDGQKIIINDGPLMGCKGSILLQNGQKTKCKVVFQGMELEVGIRSDYLSPIS